MRSAQPPERAVQSLVEAAQLTALSIRARQLLHAHQPLPLDVDVDSAHAHPQNSQGAAAAST